MTTASESLISSRQKGQSARPESSQLCRQMWQRRWPHGSIRTSLSFSAQILHIWKVEPISQYISYCSSETWGAEPKTQRAVSHKSGTSVHLSIIHQLQRTLYIPYRGIFRGAYSGTSLLWTPWGPSKVSCIERCPHFRGKFLLRKHIWDISKFP